MEKAKKVLKRDKYDFNLYTFFITRSTGKGADSLDFCGGEWKYPRTCSFEDKTCDYSARWKFDENTDMIDFTIKTRFTDKWTGIGFSDTPQMVINNYSINSLFY